ncbi:MAG: hypothetical protein ABJH04_07895 [Cyclobacteriaceae bacterium]
MGIRVRKLEQFIKDSANDFYSHIKGFEGVVDSLLIISSFCKVKNIKLNNCKLPRKSSGKVGGTTDGQSISIDFTDNHGLNYFLFWHEYAHFHLHFEAPSIRLTLKEKEQEADIFATYMCDMMFPGMYDNWVSLARDNPAAR